MNINWFSAESHVLINPVYPELEQARFNTILEAAQSDYPGHLWVATSGSTVQKWAGLSKQAVLASAQAINHHLQSDSTDCWVQTLPFFHVGGLGIWVRAYLSGALVRDFKVAHPGKWNAEAFDDYVRHVEGTLTALVPAQFYDLVKLQRRAPPTLRAVVIGGGKLPAELYRRGLELGWPLLPSYGMTECASQIATAPLEWKELSFPPLKILPHLRGRVVNGRLQFQGESLLSAYAQFQDEQVTFVNPKVDGWFMTDDRGEIQKGFLSIYGRVDHMIKIGGENVDIDRLDSVFQQLQFDLGIHIEATLIAVPDERLGCVIHLVVAQTDQQNYHLLMQRYQERVLPFERIREVHFVSQFPRSELGKILKKQLLQMLPPS